MSWYDRFDMLTAQNLPGLEVLCGELMAGYTTFRIGGPARRMACPRTLQELVALLELAEREGWPCLLIGNGSNLLVSDQGLDCLVIRTGRLDQAERLEGEQIRACAGISLARLSVFAQGQGLAGLEFAHGIPGSLGGAVYMNAGAYGGEMCQVVESVTAWFPGAGVKELSPEELDFSYRHSVFFLWDRRGAGGGAAPDARRS